LKDIRPTRHDVPGAHGSFISITVLPTSTLSSSWPSTWKLAST
jgi:hypothetical protein